MKDRRHFGLRKPCACGSTAGRIENRNGQNCVFCVKCDDYQYNAPRTEVDRYRQSVVDQLTAFLNARFDEDERVARAWPGDQRSWHGVGQRALHYATGSSDSCSVIDVHGRPVDWWERIQVLRDRGGLAAHIARRGPREDEGETRDVRYLRKCCSHCVDAPYAMPVDWPCPTIAALGGAS